MRLSLLDQIISNNYFRPYSSGRLMSVGSNGRFQTGHNTEDGAAVTTYSYIELPIASG